MLHSLIAVAIAIVVYGLIFTERIHRTIIGLFGAVAMTLIGTWLGFYSQGEALQAIDFNTIGLLLGMMIYVGMLKDTGAFEALSVWIAKITKGNAMLLLGAMGITTAALSAIIDNVTTIVFMAPITLTIAQSLGISALPLLITQAMLSNVGGISTLIGDPPNILIGSAADLSFTDFLVHMAPMVLVVFAISLVVMTLMFHKQITFSSEKYQRFQDMDLKGMIKQPQNLRRLLLVLAVGLVMFVLHDQLQLQPAAVALLIAAVSLLWVRPNVEEIVAGVEWNVLLFFTTLFVLVGGLDAVGVLDAVAETLSEVAQDNFVGAMIGLLWVSAIFSAIIDNIPFTVVMIPIILHLQGTGVDTGPLWWALALGVGLGGNGTPIGSTAGVIAVSFSERTDEPITFKKWFRTGSIVTLISLVAATGMLLLFYSLGWL